MAQIKGFTIKNITNFRGHEQELLVQGSIYYKGKKVGFYSDDSWGGEPQIDFDNKEIKAIAKRVCAEYFAEHPDEKLFPHNEPDLEEFFNKVFLLMETERSFKKNLKKGFLILATYTQDYNTIMVHGKTLEGIEDWLKDKTGKAKIYTSLSDFIIK